MYFTNRELAAIYSMAKAVASADGNISENETALIILELMRFGALEDNRADIIIRDAEGLSAAEACLIISKMTNDEKKYVSAFLGTMICADGKVEKIELKSWALISGLCDLPIMSLSEALEIMANMNS